jgi:hypothetical protein
MSKGQQPTPLNRQAVRRVAAAATRKGGGQYSAGTLAAKLDSVYQHQGGGRHAQPGSKAK